MDGGPLNWQKVCEILFGLCEKYKILKRWDSVLSSVESSTLFNSKMGSGNSEAMCIVYSKRTSKLMSSVDLSPADGKSKPSQQPPPPTNLKPGGDIESGGVSSKQKTGRQRLRYLYRQF